ncbi:four-carbon acid sugar kinase family protein [Anditalea andensis]|uniref:Serine kinase n=1 Tax=Anditalea andensis TaxID=1048983 RepID=A0A074L335_9BACT|nr:four-carbon acid sugar kinase family protein [Anditalea andensis]KEO74283.1 serine kinase [Anditalea andensis]
MDNRQPLLLAFYGDDFTGSTDALEFLNKSGIKTILFISPPDEEQLKRYEGLQAIGVAGMTRSMNAVVMEAELMLAFEALKNTGAYHVHYKVCSTFDSSPEIGSIGQAIDIGSKIFGGAYISLLVAAPALGRFCAFGNLFARMGTGSQGPVYRLDRHPSMSKHPITPSEESDLRLHLSLQTDKIVGLVDVLEVEGGEEKIYEAVKRHQESGAEVILFDAMYSHQMSAIGKEIDRAANGKTHFSVGSSGVEMALGNYWKEIGKINGDTNWGKPGKAETLLVVSGSCSPVTFDQNRYALKMGFADIALDTEKLVTEGKDFDHSPYVADIYKVLLSGKPVILHTALGNSDTRISLTKNILSEQGLSKIQIAEKTAKIYGEVIGKIIREIAHNIKIHRLVVAGGDTSSYLARALGIEAVEMIAPVVPGAPLCKAYAPGSPIDGMEVNFKGGQVGSEDYFIRIWEGNC